MTRHPSVHLSDADLLLARGGELPADRRASAAAHLIDCPRCRARQGVLESAATTMWEALDDTDPMPHEAAPQVRRARLAARLVDVSRNGGPPPRNGAPPPRAVVRVQGSSAKVVAAAVAATIAVVVGLTLREPPLRLASRGHADWEGARPIASLTPGAATELPLHEVCGSGASSSEPRAVPASVREQVLRNYGMEHVPEHEYELDYLVTPALGGIADSRNLWPERFTSPLWNARVKDELEELLPQLVCEGKVELATAQREIAGDWIAAYKKYFRTDRPLNPS